VSKDRKRQLFTILVPATVKAEDGFTVAESTVEIEVEAYTPTAALERVSRSLCHLINALAQGRSLL